MSGFGPRNLVIPFAFLLTGLFSFGGRAGQDSPPLPPTEVEASDTPNDAGGSITLRWKISPDDPERVDGYEVYRSTHSDTGYQYAGYIGRGIEEFKDEEGVEDGVTFYYKVRAKSDELGDSDFPPPTLGVVSSPQWFHTGRINALVAVVVFICLLFYFVQIAKRGKGLFIRRIAGLDAIDEAVGRATEMGKPILFIPGLSTMGDVATIAAINILSPVAKKAAEYDTRILVPNRDPIVYTVTQEVVKGAFTAAGRPDAYKRDDVFFITTSQFGFAAAVDGIMMREKPATNLFLGMFWAESLILAETGNMSGAIQIAGTDAVAQLPFFVTACDYTIIGEELYAASAYISKEPLLLGSLKAQDLGKVAILAFVFIGFFPIFLNFLFKLLHVPYQINIGFVEFIKNLFKV